MELKGKRIAFLGDSITNATGTSDPKYVYWRVFGEETGAIVSANARGGTRIARQHHLNPEKGFDPYHFGTRVNDLDPEAEVIIVFGGTNDFGHGDAPMGSMNDRTDDTFYGAMHDLCLQLINRYPTGQIVFMTPVHRYNEFSGSVNNWGVRRDHSLLDYVNAIDEVTAYYGIPVLDLYHVSGIQPLVEKQKELFMPDGLHPNDAGNRRIAEKLIGFMKAL